MVIVLVVVLNEAETGAHTEGVDYGQITALIKQVQSTVGDPTGALTELQQILSQGPIELPQETIDELQGIAYDLGPLGQSLSQLVSQIRACVD